MLLQFERDPTFRLDDSYDLTKDQQRERVMTRVRKKLCSSAHNHFTRSSLPRRSSTASFNLLTMSHLVTLLSAFNCLSLWILVILPASLCTMVSF